MKEMKYLANAYEVILDCLADDDMPLYNIPHTCIEEGRTITGVKEAIRDSMTGYIVHSDEQFYTTVYYVDVEKSVMRGQRRVELLKGLDIAQWVIERLPNKFSTFAIRIRPKENCQDISLWRTWVFVAR